MSVPLAARIVSTSVDTSSVDAEREALPLVRRLAEAAAAAAGKSFRKRPMWCFAGLLFSVLRSAASRHVDACVKKWHASIFFPLSVLLILFEPSKARSRATRMLKDHSHCKETQTEGSQLTVSAHVAIRDIIWRELGCEFCIFIVFDWVRYLVSFAIHRPKRCYPPTPLTIPLIPITNNHLDNYSHPIPLLPSLPFIVHYLL